MNRYFIGLMVPSEIRDQLRPFLEVMHANAPTNEEHKLTWTHASDLHCTLLYIGEYADLDGLGERAAGVAQDLRPVTVSVGDPTRWLGINLVLPATGADEAGSAFIKRLGHLSSNTRAVHWPFYGHVTLGKIRPKPDEAVDHLGGRSPGELSWTTEHVQLVESRSDSPGARYHVVEDLPFGQRRRR